MDETANTRVICTKCGATVLHEAKFCGMCGASVAELLARELGQPIETVEQATPRPPVVPIPLDGLLAGTEEI